MEVLWLIIACVRLCIDNTNQDAIKKTIEEIERHGDIIAIMERYPWGSFVEGCLDEDSESSCDESENDDDIIAIVNRYHLGSFFGGCDIFDEDFACICIINTTNMARFSRVLIHLHEEFCRKTNFFSDIEMYESKTDALRFLYLLAEDLSDLKHIAMPCENKDVAGLIQTFASVVCAMDASAEFG